MTSSAGGCDGGSGAGGDVGSWAEGRQRHRHPRHSRCPETVAAVCDDHRDV